MAGSVLGAGDFRHQRKDPTPGKKPEAGQKPQDTVRGSDMYVQGARGTREGPSRLCADRLYQTQTCYKLDS